MLVAHAQTTDHREILLLGLSAENRRRLVMGGTVELTIDLPGPVKIVIFVGESEDSMQAELFTKIDPATTVIDRYSREAL